MGILGKSSTIVLLHSGLRKGAILLLLFVSYWVNSQEKLDSLRLEYHEASSDSLKADLGIILSRTIHRQTHDEEEDYSYAQEAIQHALNSGDSLLYASSLDNLGLLYRYHQRYREAVPLHSKALELVENKDIPARYKMIFANNAGVASRYNQHYDSAVAFYMKALKIAEKEDDLQNIAISTNGIGNSLGYLPGREDEAYAYFERSLAAEQQRGNTLGIAMNYLSIADYFIEKKDFTTARSYLGELLDINEEMEDAYGIAITHEFYGKSFLEEGKNLEEAAAHFEKALRDFQRLGDLHKQAEILLSLGDIKRLQNSFDESEDLYIASLAIAEKLNHHGLLADNSLKLSTLYERRDQPRQALNYLKEGKAYQDSIKISEQNVEIAALIRQYDLENKENQIQLLEKDKALQQTLLVNQQQVLDRRLITMVILAMGIFFILIIVLLQYRNYRTRRKAIAEFQQEEKEKMKAIYERNLARSEILVTRLRVNPHFLFNCLNAITYLIQSEQNSKAMKYLVVFSRYTRLVLETSQKHVVPLNEELQLTKYYLALEENRFDKDFRYELKGDDVPEIEEILIPPMLLQPFIENAIWHGLLPSRKEKKMLILEVKVAQGNVEISINDNGVGRKHVQAPTNSSHKSMGMRIIQERIELYNKSYPDKITYEVIDKQDKQGQPLGTTILLKLFQVTVLKESIQQVS